MDNEAQMREALAVVHAFDEAMRNGSMGPFAERNKQRQLRSAHRKARALIAKLPNIVKVPS